jgi:flagellar basal body-associated protein FliL
MAELHVQRKTSGAVWIWLFVVLLILAAGAYYYIHYYQKDHTEITGRPRASVQAQPLLTPDA